MAQGQARRKRSSGRYDSAPSLQRIANSLPINCTSLSSRVIALIGRVECRLRSFPCGRALAEDRGADADQRGTFLDRDHEVAGHAHGEMGKFDLELRSELIPQPTQGGKISA